MEITTLNDATPTGEAIQPAQPAAESRKRCRRRSATTTPPKADFTQPLPMGTGPEIRASLEAIVEAIRTGKLGAHAGTAMVAACRLALQVLRDDQAEAIARLEDLVEQQTTMGKKRSR
jgi:hypothetical protein